MGVLTVAGTVPTKRPWSKGPAGTRAEARENHLEPSLLRFCSPKIPRRISCLVSSRYDRQGITCLMRDNPMMRNLLCLVALAAVMQGCSPKQDARSTSQSVTIWHWMTDKDEILQELAKEYENQCGVRVEFELYAPSDVYNQKVRAASQANCLPDVFGLLAEKHDLASFIKAGYVHDLAGSLAADGNAWAQRFYPLVLSHNEFDEANEYGIAPGCYGIPLDLMTVQMVYNKDLFKQAGLDPERVPKSWSEFIEYGRKLKAANIPAFVCGFGEIWLIDCFASCYAFNIMGEDKVIDTFRGNVPYTDEDWMKVFSLFKEMADEGLWYPGITNLNNKEAELAFAHGRAAMTLNGSWCVNVYEEMNPQLDFAVFAPPPVTAEHAMRVWGSAGASFLVSEGSAHRDEAIEFLKWLTDKPQQARYATATNSIPANRECADVVSPILASFASEIESSTHPSRWPIMEKGTVLEAFDKGIQTIIIADKQPQEVANTVQAVKAKEGKQG